MVRTYFFGHFARTTFKGLFPRDRPEEKSSIVLYFLSNKGNFRHPGSSLFLGSCVSEGPPSLASLRIEDSTPAAAESSPRPLPLPYENEWM